MGFDVVIPTFRGGEDLGALLAYLANNRKYLASVTIVDTGRAETARKRIAENFAAANLIDLPENPGYGAAANRGSELGAAETILFLNDDAIPEEDFFAKLEKKIKSSPGADILIPLIIRDEDDLIDSAGLFLFPDGVGWAIDRGLTLPVSTRTDRLPSGCCFAIKRNAFEGLGGFEEIFFLYAEDTELGLRALLSGYRSEFLPEAKVRHYYSDRDSTRDQQRLFLAERNGAALMLAYFPAELLLLSPIAVAGKYIRIAREIGGGSTGRPLKSALAIARGKLSQGPMAGFIVDRRKRYRSNRKIIYRLLGI